MNKQLAASPSENKREKLLLENSIVVTILCNIALSQFHDEIVLILYLFLDTFYYATKLLMDICETALKLKIACHNN